MESDPRPGAEAEPGPDPLPEPPPCGACGSPLRKDANFCPGCGAPLRGDLKPPPRRLTARQILHDVQGTASPVKGILFFYLLWLAAVIVSSVAINAGAVAVHVMMAVDLFTIAVTAGWAVGFRREVFQLYRFPRGGPAWLALPMIAAWPIAAAISVFAAWLTDLTGLDFKYTPLFFDHGYGWSWVVLIICVQPAVVEELAFRGILQTSLRDYMKPFDAVLVSAVAFSIIHWDLAIFIPFVLLGIYLAFLRQRTDSLWPSMIAHFAHNLLIVLDERWPVLPG